MLMRRELLRLKRGDYLYHAFALNADKTPQRWKVSGAVKTFRMNVNRIEVPVKRGLRSYDYASFDNAYLLCRTEQEAKSRQDVHLDDHEAPPWIRTVIVSLHPDRTHPPTFDPYAPEFQVRYCCSGVGYLLNWRDEGLTEVFLQTQKFRDLASAGAVREPFLMSLFADFRLTWKIVKDQIALMDEDGSEALEALGNATPTDAEDHGEPDDDEGDEGPNDPGEHVSRREQSNPDDMPQLRSLPSGSEAM